MRNTRVRYLWKVATIEAMEAIKNNRLPEREGEFWRRARFRELKRTWTKRNHRVECNHPPLKRTMNEKREAALERGRAAKAERMEIYRKHPQLRHDGTPQGARWRPLANLRRAARKLEAS